MTVCFHCCVFHVSFSSINVSFPSIPSHLIPSQKKKVVPVRAGMWAQGARALAFPQLQHLQCRYRSRPCKKGLSRYYYFVVKRLHTLFFLLLLKLRKGGKQNILIIIQAIRLHKRFHSFLHQT